MTWSVTNLLAEDVVLHDAWVPHGRFRGEGHVPLAVSLSPGESFDLALNVTSDEPIGSVVKNAFLIVRAGTARVFTRMRIEFTETGMRPVIESVTTMSPDDA